MLFVLSDGSPTTTTLKDKAYADSKSFAIPIHAVSLGAGSVTATMSDLAGQTGGIYAAAADANALMDSFKAIVVAKEKGYVKVAGTFPAASVPTSSSVMNLTVKSGKAKYMATITLTR